MVLPLAPEAQDQSTHTHTHTQSHTPSHRDPAKESCVVKSFILSPPSPSRSAHCSNSSVTFTHILIPILRILRFAEDRVRTLHIKSFTVKQGVHIVLEMGYRSDKHSDLKTTKSYEAEPLLLSAC